MGEHTSYLGDSVYVDIESGMFRLYTNNGLGPENIIFMESEVFEAFKSYAERIKKTKPTDHRRTDDGNERS